MDGSLWAMRNSLADALDQISSTHSTLEIRSKAFDTVEKHLATALSRRNDQDKEALDHFLALQYTFECNVPSRLLSWIAIATAQLERLAKGTTDESHDLEAFILASQLSQALSLIQGIALSHSSSKDYLGRKYPLETLVDLLLTSRHMPVPQSTADSKSRKPNPSSPVLTSIVLDTLLCILVDSSLALRSFEEAGGPQAVVRILKRSGTPREVRMKCLEFLYFYLLDENAPVAPQALTPEPSPAPSAATSPVRQPMQPAVPATPVRPSRQYLGLGATPRRPQSAIYPSSTFSLADSQSSSLRPGHPLTPESRSTSGSSTMSFGSTSSSNVSNSTAATSVASSPDNSAVFKPGRLSRDKERACLSPRKLPLRVSSEESTSPNTSSSSVGSTRTTPNTPTTSRPPSRHLQRPSLSSSRSSRGDLGGDVGKEKAFRFPAPMEPRMVMLKREVEYEPISPLKTTHSPLAISPLLPSNSPAQTPSRKSPIGLGLPGSRHVAKSKSLSNALSVTAAPSPRASSGLAPKRAGSRLGSAATVPLIDENGKDVSVPVPQRSATLQASNAAAASGIKDCAPKKTTEEKKALLGTMLGNVDALVETVSKAGIWGLA